MENTSSSLRRVNVLVVDEAWAVPAPDVRRLLRLLDEAGAPLAVPPGGLSVALLPDAQLAELHGRFCGDPSPTDVITFPGTPGSGLAGEICVSPGMAAQMGPQHGHSAAQELALYLVHAWLHLAGLEDGTEAGAAAMRREEARLLAAVAAAGAWPRLRAVLTKPA